ncbi:molybdopterin molybdenumtransferase MoeA [Halorientalis sp. IM1011]|uniref:molybdopterin molybdotransferase MoeA n=1 Tax=Halorientalis sp. IM1011 TaxID=1932360 RepID=UPI00097CCE09|nr:gephyrin-like molybdotransferase Glp [Halorientalis sp. IM1011]AQL43637.1 molybdopterin molybdenumtransferase MoeA [Halorientalis sp. IM1011]
MTDPRESGFKDVTPLADARERLREAVSPHDRTETVPLSTAAGRTVAESVAARRAVPHYDRAAMDGFAVRAEDTFGAGDRSPAVLRLGGHAEDGDEVGPDEAVRVHTGSELPPGADAVVMVEQIDTVAEDVEIFDAVAEGENVAPAGEDVESGRSLYDPGHQLRPSDIGLLKSTGVTEIECYQPPTVGVVPTGEELVQTDPDPGEIVETNGLTVAQYVERWGGVPEYRTVVTDDEHALRAAIQRDLTKDVIVTTGGSSVGERDLLPSVVDDLGEVLVHGIGVKPGHPAGFGVVEDTPVIMLPGYPVACIVNAVQLLRPAVKWAGHMPLEPHPETEAVLDRKIASEPGVRTFARVELDRDGRGIDESEDPPRATPTRASGAGVLSSVALADGWVVVPEEREGIPEGERVAVQDWEWYP